MLYIVSGHYTGASIKLFAREMEFIQSMLLLYFVDNNVTSQLNNFSQHNPSAYSVR